eukprot:292440_1
MPKTVRLNDSSIEKLKGAPRIAKHGDVAILNSHELIFAPYVRSTKERYTVWGIRKYNIHTNKWERWIQYPKRFLSPYHTIEFNQNTAKLYFYAQYTDQEHITILDIKTKRFQVHKTNYIRQDPGLSPCVVNVNGFIHILASEHGEAKHCIWNNDTLSLQSLAHCPTSIYRAAMVFVPNKQMIILFRWNEIWIYSLHNREWNQLQCGNALKLTHISAVLTSNQKHVIIRGRKLHQTVTNTGYIRVLDIAHDGGFLLRETSIKVPTIGNSFFWKSGSSTDMMLVVGYIRREFNSNSYVNVRMPPIYIMKYIGRWFMKEMVHWIAKKIRNSDKTRRHYGVAVNHILRLTK